MENFIKQTDFNVDLKQILVDLQTILDMYPWPESNQIGLKHRPQAEDIWLDASGSLLTTGRTESEFTEWNPNCPAYLKQIIQELETKFKFTAGRIRIMRLLSKRGLTVHLDAESRYHLVLKTNPFCYMFHVDKSNKPVGEHIPADGYFYWVDTTQGHFVYNGSREDRIHLVINKLG